MAVQVWIGEKPEHPNERRAIVALANGLERLDGLYLLLVNFNVGGRMIDLLVIKPDALFLIELKHCDGRISGGVNGPWFLESANGVRKQLNTGRSNPYNQVISCYYSLTNVLNDHRKAILSPHRARTINFRSCRRMVVVAPRIEEGSAIKLDWKVELKGLDELPAFLVTERSPDIELTEEEMVAIPQFFKCSRWNEINELLLGILPELREEQAPPPDANASGTKPTTTGARGDRSEGGPAPLPTSRRWLAWRSVPMWLALMSGALLIGVLTIALFLRPGARTPFLPSQPGLSLVNATSRPAGGMFAGGIPREEPRCVWTEFQPVGKRWDSQAQRWISVGVDGITMDLAPEVVVTLEKVDYCDETITLSWSVRNNSTAPVTFPLQSDNITIRDPLGNIYTISDNLSRPQTIQVEPGEQKRGIAIVSGPVVPNAPSLLVRLKDQPFGEASWLVSLEGT